MIALSFRLGPRWAGVGQVEASSTIQRERKAQVGQLHDRNMTASYKRMFGLLQAGDQPLICLLTNLCLTFEMLRRTWQT